MLSSVRTNISHTAASTAAPLASAARRSQRAATVNAAAMAITSGPSDPAGAAIDVQAANSAATTRALASGAVALHSSAADMSAVAAAASNRGPCSASTQNSHTSTLL